MPSPSPAWDCPACSEARAEAAGDQASRSTGFGRAKACILIFQWGGPSQLDTWDPKPDAPAEIRGEFRPIATRHARRVRISEHFPLLADQTHRLAIVRSMSHDDPAHLSTAHRLLTGHLAPTPVLRRRRPVAQRLAAPGRDRGQGPAESRGPAVERDDALDGRPPGRARRPGAGPGRRLARQELTTRSASRATPTPRTSASPAWTCPRASRRARMRRSPRPARRTGRLTTAEHGLGHLPGPRPRRPHLRRGPRRLPDRPRRPAPPRPLRPAHPRPVPAPGPPAGRGGRRPGDGQLARRRPELLGHARRQLQSAQEPT